MPDCILSPVTALYLYLSGEAGAGITASVPYLVELGVDCVWLSPIFKSPMKDFGYDVSDYYSIDPIFGTWDDYVEMYNALKAAGNTHTQSAMVNILTHSLLPQACAS